MLNHATIAIIDLDTECEHCTKPASCTIIPLNPDNTLSDDLNDHISLCNFHAIQNFPHLLLDTPDHA